MTKHSEAPDAPGAPVSIPPRDTKTPDEWRRIVLGDDDRGRQHPDGWKHASAAALHGWNEHAHHEGLEFQLARVDYEAALAAASEIPRGMNTYVPHPAALSSHSANAPKKG